MFWLFVVLPSAAPFGSHAVLPPHRLSKTTAWRGSVVCGRKAVPAAIESIFDPALFTPVCTISDSLYRGAQQSVLLLVGSQTYQDYAPLIAGALLRVRLELCVVESFVTEAIVPFIQEKGLSWVLPRTETVETFLAGTIFAVAVNIIFIGSSKIISVLVIFLDLLLGLPARLLSKLPVGAGSSSSKEEPKSIAVTTLAAIGVFGQILEVIRKVAEFADVFVARYLALITVVYIVFKFLHFRVFV